MTVPQRKLQISFSVYRSACYFALKHYQDCLTDIDLALEAGYPTHMVYKLYIRQCKCLLELCRIPQAQEAFDKAIDAIDRSGMKKELRKVKSASGCSFLLNWTKLAEFDLDAIHKVCNWILGSEFRVFQLRFEIVISVFLMCTFQAVMCHLVEHQLTKHSDRWDKAGLIYFLYAAFGKGFLWVTDPLRGFGGVGDDFDGDDFSPFPAPVFPFSLQSMSPCHLAIFPSNSRASFLVRALTSPFRSSLANSCNERFYHRCNSFE